MPSLPVRERSDARIAGVCAALARAWSVDPIIVRVAFVVLAVLTNGFVVVAYFALWALLPERGGEAPLHQLLPATRSWSWAALVTVVVLATATVGGIVSGSGPGAFVVLALAWVILRFGLAGRRDHSVPTPPPPPPTTPFERAAQAWQLRLDNLQAGRPADWVPELESAAGRDHGTPQDRHFGAVPAQAPARRRRRARTWLGVVVGLVVTWAGLAAASALGVAVAPLAWTSGSLLVLGLALVWCARPARAAWGRPALLLPIAVVLSLGTLPLLFPAVVPTQTPLSVSVVAPVSGAVQHLPVGEHSIDLTTMPAADETLRYQLDLGDVVLTVPREGNVVVHTRVDLGDVTLPDGNADGVDVQRTWTRTDQPGAPTRTVEVAVGLGEIEVRS